MTRASAGVSAGTASLLAGLGPFFALQAMSPEDSWQPVSTLLDEPVLPELVARAQHFLAERAGEPVHTRVAASITSLGLFARLISPYLGAAAADVELPAPSLHGISFQPTLSQPWPLHLAGPSGPADPGAALATIVEPLIERIAEEFSLSRTTLRGNAASGVFGALGMIARARPDLTIAARKLGAELLDGPLAGTGESSGSRFVRASCCLYYRIPSGGYCGDCVLTHTPGRPSA